MTNWSPLHPPYCTLTLMLGTCWTTSRPQPCTEFLAPLPHLPGALRPRSSLRGGTMDKSAVMICARPPAHPPPLGPQHPSAPFLACLIHGRTSQYTTFPAVAALQVTSQLGQLAIASFPSGMSVSPIWVGAFMPQETTPRLYIASFSRARAYSAPHTVDPLCMTSVLGLPSTLILIYPKPVALMASNGRRIRVVLATTSQHITTIPLPLAMSTNGTLEDE
jgi:hypothetical protein